jgi:hypothetical protein
MIADPSGRGRLAAELAAELAAVGALGPLGLISSTLPALRRSLDERRAAAAERGRGTGGGGVAVAA